MVWALSPTALDLHKPHFSCLHMGMMNAILFIKNERVKLQEEYLKQSKNIWTNFEGVEADKKHKKVYSEYRNKDYFLEGLQAKLEDILKDIDYYKGK